LVVAAGLVARCFASLLPPPSRLACASALARSGFSRVFEFTSTTSSGWLVEFQRIASGKRKWIVSRIACSRMDAVTDTSSTRDWWSSPCQYSRGSSNMLAALACNLTRISPSEAKFSCHFRPLRRCLPTPLALQLPLDQIRRPEREPYPAARLEFGQRMNAHHQRQPVEAHQVLAQHRAFGLPDLFLFQPAQAPVVFHLALALVVSGADDLEGAQGRQQLPSELRAKGARWPRTEAINCHWLMRST
jgi:hypothetical protein